MGLLSKELLGAFKVWKSSEFEILEQGWGDVDQELKSKFDCPSYWEVSQAAKEVYSVAFYDGVEIQSDSPLDMFITGACQSTAYLVADNLIDALGIADQSVKDELKEFIVMGDGFGKDSVQRLINSINLDEK